MGCVSSTLIGHDDDFPQIGASTAFGHHIVSLTSTTYGLLTLDDHQPPPPPPPQPSSSSSLSNLSATTTTQDTPPPPLKPDQIINSWELMAGLDYSTPTPIPTPDPSFRFSVSPLPSVDRENSNPNHLASHVVAKSSRNTNDSAAEDEVISTKCPPSPSAADRGLKKYSLDEFEKICPPNGEDKVVIYTTTLRGVRKTYEACNAVRSAMEGFGVWICERDISLDRGFREELRELVKKKQMGKDEDQSSSVLMPPRVFIKGRYIGGAEEVMRIVDQGGLQNLLQGMPKLNKAAGYVCDGCGGARFLPCFNCNGSCKIVMVVKQDVDTPLNLQQRRRRVVVLKCSHCNENGLVLCPICS